MTSTSAALKPLRFWPLFLSLLLLAVLHTLWATSLDGFTIDEPYHIAAGASYLRWGDFRVNPEHPPLVKLVVALAEPSSILHLKPLTILDDKRQERVYTQTAVYLDSDTHAVQRRSRIALILLNTLLLAWLTLLLRRVFSPSIALVTLLLLALDPTVSAHMPVVMTDLPMALLSTCCCCLTVLALRHRSWLDWLQLGLACGLLLATKHSAPLILLPLFVGSIVVLVWQGFAQHRPGVAHQYLRVAVAALLSLTVLWSTYGFRFHESRIRDAQGHFVETFNRPLDAKIADLHTPLLRHALSISVRSHLLPRAYLWGLADTLRAGVEGRPSFVVAFGHEYFDTAPAWVPLADLVVKLPLGFLCLFLVGVTLFFMRRLEAPIAWPLGFFLAMFVYFMAFISKNGVFYAGLRHWLFAVPLLAVVAAVGIVLCLQDRRLWLRLLPIAAILWIAINVLPQRRAWEFHNALAGGTSGAWRTFANESVDIGQRSEEIIAFCKAHMNGARPFYGYPTMREHLKSVGIERWEPKPEEVADGHLNAWFIFDAPGLPTKNWEHIEPLRDATPVARLGNVFIYHGSFYMPIVAAGIIEHEALLQINLKDGDRVLAERYFQSAAQLAPDDASSSWRELGNFAVLRGENDEALRYYRLAIHAEKDSPMIRGLLQHQIDLVEQSHGGKVAPMRDPKAE